VKNVLKHIAITLNLLVFLFSISGFTIYRHECFKSGIVHVSVAEITDCCEKKEDISKPKCCKKKAEHKEKKKCCSDSKFSKQLKTDYTFSAKKSFSDQFVIIPAAYTNEIAVDHSIATVFSYTDPSPPLSGRNILVKKQSFLI